MSIVAILVIAFGLSADSFAVSLARGAAGKVAGPLGAPRLGLLFGTSEALMTCAGWALASRFAEAVTHLDHWIALVLLGGVGGHMLWEGLHDGAEAEVAGAAAVAVVPAAPRGGPLGNLITVLGTSIDAAAVGVALAFIAVDIRAVAAVIGGVSFSMSTLGLLIGPRVGRYLGRHAVIAGGLVLIGIGGFIFVSHAMAG